MGRAVIADAGLSVAVLVGIPLAIGATGSSPSGDVVAGWRVLVWTLPDIGVALLCLSIVPMVVGMLKLARHVARRSPGASPLTPTD